MDAIPVCVGYEGKVPVCPSDFFETKPFYEKVNGWKDSHDFNQLVYFIATIEEFTGVEVSHISCGTDEKDIVHV